MRRSVIAISIIVILACSPAPVLDLAAHANLTVPTATLPAIETEEIGRVVVDALTVRDCPDETCTTLSYLQLGHPLAGECLYFEDGDVWLNLGWGFVAVKFGGEILVEGVCQ